MDQTPTPQQAQQLAMMDEIYHCSTITIIAISGEDSATGLPGVSTTTPRIPQGVETINGKEILTVFPMLVQDMVNLKYQTRAWTMQEALLSRCRLVFTKHQVHWWCSSAAWAECIDETDDPANYTACYHPEKQESWHNNVRISIMISIGTAYTILACTNITAVHSRGAATPRRRRLPRMRRELHKPPSDP